MQLALASNAPTSTQARLQNNRVKVALARLALNLRDFIFENPVSLVLDAFNIPESDGTSALTVHRAPSLYKYLPDNR